MKLISFNIIKNKRRIWTFSSILLIFSLIGIITSTFNPNIRRPINLGLDFIGGNEIRIDRVCLNTCSSLTADDLLNKLKNSFEDKKLINTVRVQLQNENKLISIRTPYIDLEKSEALINKLDQVIGPLDFDSKNIRSIGPKLGKDLLLNGLISLVLALLAISVYLSFRFDRKFSLLALTALFHDLFIVFGIFAWLGIIFSVEVNSLFAVSLLTIAGYSVNDTVVIFDRIRENSKNNKVSNIDDIVQLSVNESFRRTIFTSFTTLIPLIALMIFGSYSLLWFSLSLSIGIIVGSYSSILLSPSLLLNNK